MFAVTVEHKFSAGHSLRNYHGRCENIHGHNWKVEVEVAGDQLDSAGMLVDFLLLKQLINRAIDPLDHQFLNDVPPFDTQNPSAENIARYVYEELATGLAGANDRAPVRISQVRVWETDDAAAVYRL
jgi:6-pyruvoyltetrahydropterin/6-carboxytetrahydropterin synthase